MYKWAWSKFYDKITRDAEDKCLRNWRRTLLENISGDVLELGCGTGVNLEFYSPEINRLVLTEPNRYMRQKLQMKIISCGVAHIEVLNDKAEQLSLPDASFDAVICTLVLCSVKDLGKSLAEIYRILRPKGQLIFLEHVAAIDNPKRHQWQHRLEFIWKCVADGCHVTRCTENAIITAGFKIIDINRQSIRGVPPIARPSIRGIALKG